jgi:hypothetical protein
MKRIVFVFCLIISLNLFAQKNFSFENSSDPIRRISLWLLWRFNNHKLSLFHIEKDKYVFSLPGFFLGYLESPDAKFVALKYNDKTLVYSYSDLNKEPLTFPVGNISFPFPNAPSTMMLEIKTDGSNPDKKLRIIHLGGCAGAL